MSRSLEELQGVLREGQRRSGQGSYMRRAPAKESVPYLLEARSGLKEYLRGHGDSSEAWRLLSQAEECLLNYSAARECCERAMSLSGVRDKKDLKRLALLKECEADWSDLMLSPSQLEELGDHLRGQLSEAGCDHTLRFTQEWLKRAVKGALKRHIDAIRNRGGFCDCEVLCNVVGG